jgi:Tfp pilus assembly protein PilN
VAAVAAGLVVAAGLGLWAGSYWQLLRQLEEIAAAKATLAPVVAEAEQLEQTLAQAQQEHQALKEIIQRRYPWSRFLAELRRSLPEGVWLVSLSVKGAELTLEGKAKSPGEVALLLERLGFLPEVRDPQLIRAERGAELSFTVKAKLDRPLPLERGDRG